MARSRRRTGNTATPATQEPQSTPAVEEVTEENGSVTDTEPGNTNPENATEGSVSNVRRENKMAGLTPEQISALLGKTRTKGDYVVKLNQFVESGEAGVCVNENWVELKDKKATTLKQGFENAKDNKGAVDGAANVKVISNEDLVFLINLATAQGVADEASEPVAA